MPRKRIHGYTDFGGIRIPPLPQFIGVEDRATTVIWYFTLTGDDPNQAIAFTTEKPHPESEITYFGPYEGPYLDDNLRLYMQDGFFLIEYAQGPGKVNNQGVFFRRGNERTIIQIQSPPNFRIGDELIVTKITL